MMDLVKMVARGHAGKVKEMDEWLIRNGEKLNEDDGERSR